MSGLTDLVDSLENKLEKLIQNMDLLKEQNQKLEDEISKSAIIISSQSDEITSLKEQNETLRMANSLLGSNDNKRETKLKINSLIREIDYCIAQLSD
ncbi:hypothetical protein GCM10007424_12980 [Flavobacterium suaedae]|uniref:Mis12-Mtw1 protein family n=1 Tax=Flavobacterium suaedae TaxID=1767027 RepID=A0ABQ1JPR5_9FLAO|nr:hypothetical protein [Flavobacterium suaedae]GGB74472.1 hypothetical protein GCM10007424_12980 [Flavobacterium suaedae]